MTSPPSSDAGTARTRQADRLRELAAEYMRWYRHQCCSYIMVLSGHQGEFETCPHPDCVLVRSVAPLPVEEGPDLMSNQEEPSAACRHYVRTHFKQGDTDCWRCDTCGVSGVDVAREEPSAARSPLDLEAIKKRNGQHSSKLVTREQIDALIAEVELLREAAPPPQGWQPIETAPKDGNVLLAFSDGRVTHGWYEVFEGDAQIDVSRAGWVIGCEGFPTKDWPTHWMPLPAPPQRAEQVGKE